VVAAYCPVANNANCENLHACLPGRSEGTFANRKNSTWCEWSLLRRGRNEMLVTEREARSLWCPMVRVRVRTLNGANRVNPGLRRRFYYWLLRTLFPNFYWFLMARYYACTGSKCMMWRWESESSPRGFCGLMGHQAHATSAYEDLDMTAYKKKAFG
jgi:hypothetical protein